MEEARLKQLMIEHKERFLTKSDLVKREIQSQINNFLKHKEIIVITGIRRGGKSSLMKLIANDIIEKFKIPQDNILYLNFEDERFTDFTFQDFEKIYEIFLEIYSPYGRKYFFLDEIQNITGWEKWVNRLHQFEDIKIFVTGSNATLLSSEISTALVGRNRQLTNWPFSFREFLLLRNFSISEKDIYLREKKIKLKNSFKEYLKLGSFPEVLKIKDTTLLEQYFKDIIYRDVIVRYSIRNPKELKELCLYLASNIATIYSYENLKDFIKAKNINTIKNYIEILENVFLFFRVNRFDYSIRKQIYNPGKFYSIDIALSNSIGFRFSENLGHIYENIVFLELKRKNEELYYWKSKTGKEVDFVLKKGLKIEEAIQVSFNLSDIRTKNREIEALLDAKNELKVNKLTLITEDKEEEEKIGNTKIKIIPLWKWLLLEIVTIYFDTFCNYILLI